MAGTGAGFRRRPAHLHGAVVGASGPLLQGWAGPGQGRGAAGAPQALQEEVVDGREVIIAVVLQ